MADRSWCGQPHDPVPVPRSEDPFQETGSSGCGRGETASTEQDQDIHSFIREGIAKKNANIAKGLTILYGGSVKENNASELFDMPDIDGGLIGGASLVAVDFVAICRALHQ